MSIVGNGKLSTISLSVEQMQAALERHESIIEKNMDGFIAVGASLRAIQDQKLYKSTHGTFEAYIADRWGKSRSWAYKLIGAVDSYDVENVENFPQNGRLEKQDHAKALADVPPENRAEVLERLEQSGKRVTARAIQAEAAEMAAPPKAASGVVAPDGAPFENAINLLTQTTRAVNELLDSPAGFFLVPSRQTVEADLRNVRYALKTAKPAGECLYCKGRGKYRGKDCDGCKGQGWYCVGVARAAPKVMEAESIFEADDSDALERLAIAEIEAAAEREAGL